MDDVYNLSPKYWNEIEKEDEVDVEAQEGDLIAIIGGVMFLVQKQNEINNVLCFRVGKSEKSFLKTLYDFRDWMIANNTQYLRVEGNTKRYKFLSKIDVGGDYNVLQDNSITNRNVFYVRLY